jgi:hypothetical protein
MISLRKEYESELGKSITDRTWYRIKKRLYLSSDTDPSRLQDVRIYARLRAVNRGGGIKLIQARNYERLCAEFCEGNQFHAGDLLKGIENNLNPKPHRSTIYRWGQQIGLPFRKNRWYTAQEIKIWLRKIIGQSRFKPIQKLRIEKYE